MMQFTTINWTNTPRLFDSDGVYACIARSTTVTNEAMITMYDGILTRSGMKSFNRLTKMFNR